MTRCRSEAQELAKIARPCNERERERLRDLKEKEIKADAERIRKNSFLDIQVNMEGQDRIRAEIEERGNVSERTARESLMIAIFALVLLVVSIAGEFAYAKWMIAFFGLNPIETILVAATIVIISLKGFDLYLESIRRHYPEHESRHLLVISCIGLVAIFLLLFFSAELRQALQEVVGPLSTASDPEEIIRRSDEFYTHHSGMYISLLTALTLSFTIIGGVSFHVVKNRIPFSWSILKLYRRLRKTRDALRKASELIIVQEGRVEQFNAEYAKCLMKEESEHRKATEKQNTTTRTSKKAFPSHVGSSLITLILIALVLFLLLRGLARGAEHHILLDLSKSVGVSDYKGKDTEFSKNIHAIEDFIRHRLAPGDGIMVVGITEQSFANPYTLMNARLSKKKGAFGEVLARERVRLLNQWKKQDLKPCARATDIFGAIALSSISFSPHATNKRLMIYSDMRNCTREVNIEKPERIDGEKVLAQVKKHGLIPQLDKVEVLCLGVHSSGKSLAYWQDLRKFWHQFFRLSQANLKIFSRERRIP